MTQVAQQQPLDAARVAFSRHAWREAYDRFAEADAVNSLEPAELESYSEAAWWCGQPEAAIRLRERAYTVYIEAGHRQRAANVALLLFDSNALRRAETVASAWLAKAERLLDRDEDSREYGQLRFRRAMIAAQTNDQESAIAESRAALELGERHGDRDLQAGALTIQGMSLVAKGEVREGMALVDEATVAAVGGELSLFMTGWVYCNTISACRDLGDYRRASEWTEAAHRWCDRQSVTGFPGICRVHRAEVMALRGALAKAEQEARLACDELVRWDIQPIVGEAFYEIGSIRLRMGDLPAAEAAFRQAHELGRVPEPGMSLVRLAEGKAAVANASLRRVLAEERSRPARARLRSAQVEAALAAGDLETARAATDELEEIAESFDSVALRANARCARGALLLAEGDAEAAQRELRLGLQLWQELDAPYEAAQARLHIARACRVSGDEDAARLELNAAKTTFERIGAQRDARAAAALLGEGAETSVPASPAPRVARTFFFTDIVGSTNLIGVIGDAAWQDLIRWHDDTLRAVIAEHGGEEIRHQGDGLVVAFDDPARAIDCAIAIQRRLAEHRRAHGFAPAVRIGLHRAEATKRGLDYAGVGVHAAARVGALAGDGEILVTRATLDASARACATGDARTVQLKGIVEPVEVLPIAWR
jgi:class 3 adenylate cyclase